MYKLGKMLFPNNPRMVRYRKLRMLFVLIFLCLLACAVVGGLLFLLNQQSRF